MGRSVMARSNPVIGPYPIAMADPCLSGSDEYAV